MDLKQLKVLDRFCGVLHGQFLGDALIRYNYYSHYSLDSVQMLCVLESILSCSGINIFNIASYLQERALSGILKQGETLSKVILHKQFLESPQIVAYNYWSLNHRTPAGNGALIRAPITGLWGFDDIEKVKEQAAEVCKMTHADPRCVATSVGIALIVAYFTQGETDIDKIFDKVEQHINHYHKEIPAYFEKIKAPSLDIFALKDYSTYGYTLKTFGAVLWCLKNIDYFQQAVKLLLVESGNNVDLSLIGALFGARYGIASLPSGRAISNERGIPHNRTIPHELVMRYRNASWLNKQAVKLHKLNLRINSDYAETPRNDYELVQESIRLMKKYLKDDKELTLSELCEKFKKTSPTLTGAFNYLAGMSPMKYWQTLVLERGAELLRNTDKSILDISTSCFYESQANFTVAFKRKYQCTPTEYRQRYRKNA